MATAIGTEQTQRIRKVNEWTGKATEEEKKEPKSHRAVERDVSQFKTGNEKGNGEEKERERDLPKRKRQRRVQTSRVALTQHYCVIFRSRIYQDKFIVHSLSPPISISISKSIYLNKKEIKTNPETPSKSRWYQQCERKEDKKENTLR